MRFSNASRLIGAGLTLLASATSFADSTVTIDLNTQKFIGGHSQLDRSKYFNLHTTHSENQVTNDELDYLTNDLNAGFGRGFWSPFSAHKGHDSYPNEATAKTNGARNIASTKNHSNYAYFSDRYIVTDHPRNAFAANQDPQKAAEWAANYFKHYFDDSTRPLFYEPINEPFVHAGEFGIDADLARSKITELFKQIGKKFDQENIDTKVIGYAGAWPSMELWDFKHFDTRMKMFMDSAGQYMDAFSVHLYDGVNVTGANSQRSGSNLDAILDLVESYSFHKWAQVKPLAITEYGGIEKGYGDTYSDIASVQSIRSINNMLFQLLDRQDRLLTTIPFITGKASWHYNAGNNWEPYGAVITRPDPTSIVNGKPTRFIWTPRIHFYQLWSEVSGVRVKTQSTNPDVQVQAFVDGNKAYVALNSLSESTEQVSLDFVNSLGSVNQLTKKSLKIYPNKAAVYQDQSNQTPPQNISLIAGETVVLQYTFNQSIQLDNTLKVDSYYSASNLQEITANQAINFSINNVNVAQGTSNLKVSIGRKHNKSKKPVVKVNGTAVSVPNNWKGGDQSSRDDFFGALHIPVANSLLAKNNTISITFPDSDGRVSSVVLEVNNQSNAAVGQDAISFAESISSLAPGKNYAVKVNYSASQSRDLTVSIWQGQNYLAGNTVNVAAGEGSKTLNVSLANDTIAGDTDYIIKANIRPQGGDVASIIKQTQINDIVIEDNAGANYDQIVFVDSYQQLNSALQYTVELDYSAMQQRDIVVELWDEQNWLASGKTTVPAGEGKTSVTIELSTAPPAGSQGYKLKGSIRPLDTSWQDNLDFEQISNIEIVSATPSDDATKLVLSSTELAQAQRYQFTVDYSATQQRDVVVELWLNNQWISQATEQVEAGEGSVTLTIELDAEAQISDNYMLKNSIRPLGTDWRSSLATSQIDQLSIVSDALSPPSSWTNLQFKHSAKCMDVAGGNTSNGSNYHQWTCNTQNDNQRFMFTPLGDNWYTIKAKVSNKCVDLHNGNTANGAKLQQYTCYNNNPNQAWQLLEQQDGWFELRAKPSDKCIDVSQVSSANQALIHQWNCGKQANQLLRFIE
ncbi:RICIN domain-containing protein [Agarivorans sp. Alg241-V36]|uniref:RICIN domain-containing protein n=1 Tax=Agarivorans sp. Alg241-V36 TaxID=2305992 RepID=UPI0013D2F81F|nr:RICIN domain-containing protein [Agarivorans sp. Alg241-V36]